MAPSRKTSARAGATRGGKAGGGGGKASSGLEGLIDVGISIIGQHQHLRGHARDDLVLRLRDRRGD